MNYKGFDKDLKCGDCGAAIDGNFGIAVSRGTVSVGQDGCGLVRGKNVKIRGGLGAVLVICLENNDDYNIADYRTLFVDDITIKADTWYTIKNGEVVEVDSHD